MQSHSIYCDNALSVMRGSTEKRCTKLIDFLKMLSLKLYIFFYKKRKEIDKILRYVTGLLSRRLIPEAPFMPNDFETSLSIHGDNTQCVMAEWKIDSELELFLNGKYNPIMESLGCGERIYLSECMEEMEVEIPNDFINNELKEPNSSQVCFVKSPSIGKNKTRSSPLLRGKEQEGTSHLQPGGSPKPFTGFFC